MKREYFGTDGVRGVYGGPVMNERFARRLGWAAGRWLAAQGVVAPTVISGRDTRRSGASLERAVAAGLQATGAEVQTAGVAPTPAVSMAVRRFRASLGVVITASHNPGTDNGIKFFGPGGTKLDDAAEYAIEGLLPAGEEVADDSRFAQPLATLPVERVYTETLSAIFDPGALTGWRIVVDAGNGAAYRTTPAVLRRLGADVVVAGDAPDGANINAGCGSQHPEGMCAKVVETRARLGLAHDGDADRLVLADETGAMIDGDEILAILGEHALASGRLNHRTLVATVQSNMGLKAFMEKLGGRLVQTAVGDRYVIEAMLAGGYNLGGESSGHIICLDVAPCGDGLAAALLVMRAMRDSGRPLSGLRRGLVRFPQITRALDVGRKPEIETLPVLSRAIREAGDRLGESGRVLVRYSGTEPKIRLLVEGPDAALVTEVARSLESAVRRELPAP